MTFENVPLKKLPDQLFDTVNNYVRLFALSIGVLPRCENPLPWTCSASLVELNGVRGLLTARHVWEKIAAKPCDLYFMLDNKGYEFDPQRAGTPLMPPVEGKYLPIDEGIPDIAFVPLPSHVQTDIETRNKVFYSIDRRRSLEVTADDGYWVAVGTPAELMKHRSDIKETRLGSMVYATSVGKRSDVLGWDLIHINLNLPSNPQIPTYLGGMSGGGLWRVRLYIREDRSVFLDEDHAKGIVLSGVVFLQTEPEGSELVAHGPKSIYSRFGKQ
jgi:hypothetical protein